ncbi:MAG: hypothetical protein ACKV0T_17285 [Planctomycetales bacterium]
MMVVLATREERTFGFKSPMRKLLAFFQRSRDAWKSKYMALNERCKLLSNQVRAVEKSRQKWRQEAAEAQQLLQQLQQELERVKNTGSRGQLR